MVSEKALEQWVPPGASPWLAPALAEMQERQRGPQAPHGRGTAVSRSDEGDARDTALSGRLSDMTAAPDSPVGDG
ncbi:unnamed protein product [Arctogadus glacialis]